MFPASYQTTLPTLTLALAVYRCRWGIEQLFKDCKTGGYRLEATTVNATRFLALVLLIAIAYGLATMHGHSNPINGSIFSVVSMRYPCCSNLSR